MRTLGVIGVLAILLVVAFLLVPSLGHKAADLRNQANQAITDSLSVDHIVEVARKCVEIIDMQPKDDIIYVNITSGRKTKAIGLLFAAYARHDRVKKIAYNPEEDKTAVVYLPRLSFKLSESEKKILEVLDKGKYETPSDIAGKVDMSTAMLYRALDELRDMDLITTEEGLKLTDAGKIARL